MPAARRRVYRRRVSDERTPTPPALFTWEFAADPHPAYGWLREHSPVHRTTLPSGGEAWLVTRYRDSCRKPRRSRLRWEMRKPAGVILLSGGELESGEV
jgi:cytochrome P450